jgi:hypothetical protein
MDNYLLVIGSSGQVIQTRNNEISIGNGTLTLPSFAANDLAAPAKKSVNVNATAQVTTLTITAANSTDYQVSITLPDATSGTYRNWIFNYTSAASGDDATSIGNYFRTQINNAGGLNVAATGTTTLILTAVAPFYIFDVKCTANIAEAATTPGVVPVGIGTWINDYSWFANMNYANVTGNTIADGTTYLVYQLVINQRSTAGAGVGGVNQLPLNAVILVDSSNTTAESALDTALGTSYES